MIPTLLGTSVVIFFLFALLQGIILIRILRLHRKGRKELRELYGLNKPIVERYFHWLGNALQGDFGFSLQYQEPVTSLLNKFIWNSFIVAIVALFFIWLIALIIGVFSATKQHSLFDKLVTIGIFAAMSFPSFFIGLFLIKVFAVDLNLLPIGGMIDVGSNSTGFAYVIEVAKHMVLPVFILTLLGVGSLTRYFRTSMLEVVRQDYIRTARAKGLKEKTVIYKHALKNAILPAITLLAFELPGLFSGAIIIEQIFNWPGIGGIQLEALNFRDYTVLMAFTMFFLV